MVSTKYQRDFSGCDEHPREPEELHDLCESFYSVDRPGEYSAFIMNDKFSSIMMPDPFLPSKWSTQCSKCSHNTDVIDTVIDFNLISEAPPILMFMCMKTTKCVSKEFTIANMRYCLSAVLYYWKIVHANGSTVWHYTCDVQKGGVWFHCDDTEIDEVSVSDENSSYYSVSHNNGNANDDEAFDSDNFGHNGGDNVAADIARGINVAAATNATNVGSKVAENSRSRYPFLCIYSLVNVNDKDEVDQYKQLGEYLTLKKTRKK
jgi:hypothetical protein